MKRVCGVVVLLTVWGTLAFGQVTQVVSRNAVGYVKISITNGGFFMAQAPFNKVGDTERRTVTEVMGDQLTGTDGIVFGSDFLLRWDPDDQVYRLFWKANNAGNPEWRDENELFIATTSTLAPGEGFFIQNNQPTSQSVFVMGEVPDSFTVPENTATVFAVEGFNQIGYSFPVEVPINDTSLDEEAQPGIFGDQILRWDPASQAFVGYFLNTNPAQFGGAGWIEFNDPSAPTTDKFAPGEAFFYNRTVPGVIVWEEEKPYDWP